jgi:hypothetical protein
MSDVVHVRVGNNCDIRRLKSVHVGDYTAAVDWNSSMSPESPIISVGDICKPATTLIEKISDALGGLFRPYQITRIAKAEAEADLIKAAASIDVQDLQRRALVRFAAEEARKQVNIESITRRAIPLLNDGARPESMDEDWIAAFFDTCRLISNEQMQSVWAKVLAGEANSPGAFSKRTIALLGSLDRTDARMFEELCAFAWSIGGHNVPLVFDMAAPFYSSNGLTFDVLNHLASIGVISLAHFTRFSIEFVEGTAQVDAVYAPSSARITISLGAKRDVNVGNVLFTQVGRELATICEARSVDGYVDFALKQLRASGVQCEASETDHECEISGSSP